MAARPHRADEDAWVEEVIAQPDAVAEESAVRERARRIDRHDADRNVAFPHEPQERRDEARLADTRRPGEADRVHLPGLGIDVGDELVRERIGVLDERDRAGERTAVAAANAGGESLSCPVAAAGHRGGL